MDERWESRELKLIVAARSTDTRLGDVEYTLTNVRRGELPANLFEVPADADSGHVVAAVGDSALTLIPLESYPRLRARSR